MRRPPGESASAPGLRSARRSLAWAQAAQVLLLLGVGCGLAIGVLLRLDWVIWAALVLATIWVLLVLRSARLVRGVREAWAAVQVGGTELAHTRASHVLASPTLLRPATVSAVAVLAACASRQERHAEAAELAEFVLSRRERLLVSDRQSMQLLLVESHLAAGQLEAAKAAMLPLYATRLPLAEALQLLLLQLRAEARMGAYSSMTDRLWAKVDLAELMPPRESAVAQALLAVAAERTGLEGWAAWLRQRVSLLADVNEMQRTEPLLGGFLGPGGTLG